MICGPRLSCLCLFCNFIKFHTPPSTIPCHIGLMCVAHNLSAQFLLLFTLNAFPLSVHHMLLSNLQIPDQISPSQRGFSWPPWPSTCSISSTYSLKLLLISFISFIALISISYYSTIWFFLPY